MTSTKINHRQNDDNLINLKTSKVSDKEAVIFEKGIAVKWLSTHQAANYLAISPNALRILVHRGKVKAFKFGVRLRFRLSDLLSLLEKKEA